MDEIVLSEDSMYLVLKNGVHIQLKQDQYEKIKVALSKGVDTLQVNNSIITKFSIDGIYTYEELHQIIMRKRGYWMCKFGRWHGRYENCDHKYNPMAKELAKLTQIARGK